MANIGGPILVVDDDDSIRDFVQMALVDEGYEVVLAANGLEALERIDETKPKVIILDLRMPTMNGWQFAEEYRKKPGPHAPIVALTAGNDVPEAASEIGADCHLAKPFELEDLVAAVRGCTGT